MARVHLFGGFRIEREDWSTPVRFTRAAETVLSYLVIHREGGHARDELAGRFWGDMPEDRARNCLNTTLWRIRRVLEPDAESRGSFIKTVPSGDVRFSPAGPCWIDVAVFKQALDELLAIPPDALSDDEVARLAAAIDLYTSDILIGTADLPVSCARTHALERARGRGLAAPRADRRPRGRQRARSGWPAWESARRSGSPLPIRVSWPR